MGIAPYTIDCSPKFIALTLQYCIKKVAELMLCNISLRQHSDKRCTSRNCFRFAKPPNSLLDYPQQSLLPVKSTRYV